MVTLGNSLGPRRWLLLSVGSVVLAVGGVTIFLPSLRTTVRVVERYQAERSLLRSEEVLHRELDALVRELGEVGTEVRAAETALLPGPSPFLAQAALSALIERAAVHAPARITVMEPLPPSDLPNGLTAIRIHVAGESDLEGVLFLITVLESLSVVLDVGQVSLAGRGEPTPETTGLLDEPEVLAFRLVATGYHRISPEGFDADRPGEPADWGASQGALGPAFDSLSEAVSRSIARNPFRPDRRPARARYGRVEMVPSAELPLDDHPAETEPSFRIVGVAVSADASGSVLAVRFPNGGSRVVRVGEEVEGLRLVELSLEMARFEGPLFDLRVPVGLDGFPLASARDGVR